MKYADLIITWIENVIDVNKERLNIGKEIKNNEFQSLNNKPPQYITGENFSSDGFWINFSKLVLKLNYYY